MKQAGEVLRRIAFFGLDGMRGGKMRRLLDVNKSEIIRGITQEYQDRRLDQILTYARENCEFYRDLPANESLTDFPVQNKGDLIEHYEGILSDKFRDERDKLTKLSTSGSTGTPFTVLADRDKMSHVYMNFMSVMELNGFRLGMKRGEFRAWIKGKNTISRWHSFKNNLLMIDISNMGDESVKAILDRIKRDRIQVLVAYSSAIQALCDYVESLDHDWCLTHIDAVPDNFLFYGYGDSGDSSDEQLQLTDWEYAGMQDPHVDIAMFCIYSLYNRQECDRLIDIYFEGRCNRSTRTKIYIYIAMCGLLWSNWCEYKRKLGVEFGEYNLRQYRYAKDFYRAAKEMMESADSWD